MKNLQKKDLLFLLGSAVIFLVAILFIVTQITNLFLKPAIGFECADIACVQMTSPLANTELSKDQAQYANTLFLALTNKNVDLSRQAWTSIANSEINIKEFLADLAKKEGVNINTVLSQEIAFGDFLESMSDSDYLTNSLPEPKKDTDEEITNSDTNNLQIETESQLLKDDSLTEDQITNTDSDTRTESENDSDIQKKQEELIQESNSSDPLITEETPSANKNIEESESNQDSKIEQGQDFSTPEEEQKNTTEVITEPEISQEIDLNSEFQSNETQVNTSESVEASAVFLASTTRVAQAQDEQLNSSQINNNQDNPSEITPQQEETPSDSQDEELIAPSESSSDSTSSDNTNIDTDQLSSDSQDESSSKDSLELDSESNSNQELIPQEQSVESSNTIETTQDPNINSDETGQTVEFYEQDGLFELTQVLAQNIDPINLETFLIIDSIEELNDSTT